MKKIYLSEPLLNFLAYDEWHSSGREQYRRRVKYFNKYGFKQWPLPYAGEDGFLNNNNGIMLCEKTYNIDDSEYKEDIFLAINGEQLEDKERQLKINRNAKFSPIDVFNFTMNSFIVDYRNEHIKLFCWDIKLSNKKPLDWPFFFEKTIEIHQQNDSCELFARPSDSDQKIQFLFDDVEWTIRDRVISKRFYFCL